LEKNRGKQEKQSIHSLDVKIELGLFSRPLFPTLRELLPSGCASIWEAPGQYKLNRGEVRGRKD
jgi:hypothetical protein